MILRFFLISLFLIFFIDKDIKAQKEADVWIIGNDFGIDFNYNRFSVFDRPTFVDKDFFGGGGTSASICDSNTGELLFYSDSKRVWNRDFQVMPKGDNIIGSIGFGTTQSTLILPYPGRKNLYYLFSARSYSDSVQYNEKEGIFEIVPTGLYYSLVNMKLDGGKGDVVADSKNVLLLDKNAPLVTAVPKPDSEDYWLVTCRYNENRFVIYPVTAEGIGLPGDTESSTFYGLESDDIDGCIKFSPDGTKMVFLPGNQSRSSPEADPNAFHPIELYDFDPLNGFLSNRRVLGEYPNLISASFSPDNSKLYISYFYNSNSPESDVFPPLLQFDLDSGSTEAIIASKTSIEWNPSFEIITPVPSYALHLAPDGRLYNAAYTILENESGNRQRVIFYLDKPNLKGQDARPTFRFLDSPNNTFAEGNTSFTPTLLFPNFPQHYFDQLEPVDNFLTSGECDTANFILFPNPVEDILSIRIASESCLLPATLKVYNAIGQLLDEGKILNQNINPLDLTFYPKGMYLLLVETGKKTFTYKILKE